MRSGRAVKNVGVVLAAGAVGAGVALLFAPHSGARTRRMIRRKAEDVGRGARDVYDRVIENGNGAARTLAYRLKMRLTPRRTADRVGGA